MPVDLLRAISHANKILDWHENLVEKEIPPEWMWPFDKAISEWFDDVKQAREHPEEVDTREIVPLTRNELSRDRR